MTTKYCCLQEFSFEVFARRSNTQVRKLIKWAARQYWLLVLKKHENVSSFLLILQKWLYISGIVKPAFKTHYIIYISIFWIFCSTKIHNCYIYSVAAWVYWESTIRVACYAENVFVMKVACQVIEAQSLTIGLCIFDEFSLCHFPQQNQKTAIFITTGSVISLCIWSRNVWCT